jgi:hypothetical protein
MTHYESLKAVEAVLVGKVSLDTIFEVYDIMGKANMQAWKDGKREALETFAPDIAKILATE